MEICELLEKYGRAQLGVDGTAAFALLGGDLQEGEVEFVDVGESLDDKDTIENRQIVAAKQALYKLRERLNLPHLSYYLGKSHPMYL